MQSFQFLPNKSIEEIEFIPQTSHRPWLEELILDQFESELWSLTQYTTSHL